MESLKATLFFSATVHYKDSVPFVLLEQICKMTNYRQRIENNMAKIGNIPILIKV